MKRVIGIGAPLVPASLVHGYFVEAHELGVEHDLGGAPRVVRVEYQMLVFVVDAKLVPHLENLNARAHGHVGIVVGLELVVALAPQASRYTALILKNS